MKKLIVILSLLFFILISCENTQDVVKSSIQEKKNDYQDVFKEFNRINPKIRISGWRSNTHINDYCTDDTLVQMYINEINDTIYYLDFWEYKKQKEYFISSFKIDYKDSISRVREYYICNNNVMSWKTRYISNPSKNEFLVGIYYYVYKLYRNRLNEEQLKYLEENIDSLRYVEGDTLCSLFDDIKI